MSRPPRDLLAAGIGALAIGLLATPWAYVGLGALSAFSPQCGLLAGLLLAVITVDLGLSAFAGRRDLPRLLTGTLSALVLLALLWELSNFTLMTKVERAGLFALAWLGTSALWLLISLPLGGIGPERWLGPLLRAGAWRYLASVAAILLVCGLAALAWYFLVTPPVFIG